MKPTPGIRRAAAAILAIALLSGAPLAAAAVGDANDDGAVDVLDVFYLINHLFAGGAAPLGNADADGSGLVDVGDVFYLINALFAGGPVPL